MKPAPLHERSLHACVDPQCLDKVHDLVAQLWVEATDVSELDRALFEVAVLEIAGNILQHSVSEEAIICNLNLQVYPGRLDAIFLDSAEEVTVDLTNRDLPPETAESGRGLAMTISVLDQLSYEREGSLNCWRLSRSRTG